MREDLKKYRSLRYHFSVEHPTALSKRRAGKVENNSMKPGIQELGSQAFVFIEQTTGA